MMYRISLPRQRSVCTASGMAEICGQKAAEKRQHRARYQADGPIADPVGKSRRKQTGRRCDNDAQQHHIPFFEQDGRMDQNVAHRGDQRRKGHDERARAHCGLQFHAEKCGENDQHHHTAARSHEAGAKAYGQAKEQRDRNALPVQLFAPGGSVLPAGIRPDQKADADEEGQKEREAAQHDVADAESRVAADGAHPEDTHQHDPAPLQVDVLMSGIGIGCYRRTEDIRCQCNRRCLIRACLTGEGRTEDNQDRHHDGSRRKPGQPRPDARPKGGYDIPYPLHS